MRRPGTVFPLLWLIATLPVNLHGSGHLEAFHPLYDQVSLSLRSISPMNISSVSRFTPSVSAPRQTSAPKQPEASTARQREGTLLIPGSHERALDRIFNYVHEELQLTKQQLQQPLLHTDYYLRAFKNMELVKMLKTELTHISNTVAQRATTEAQKKGDTASVPNTQFKPEHIYDNTHLQLYFERNRFLHTPTQEPTKRFVEFYPKGLWHVPAVTQQAQRFSISRDIKLGIEQNIKTVLKNMDIPHIQYKGSLVKASLPAPDDDAQRAINQFLDRT
jgi:hypothetical protein